MKKKLFGMIFAVVLVVSQAVTVFAAGSKEAGVSPAGDSQGAYTVTEGSAAAFSYLEGTADAVLARILAVNEGSAGLDSIAAGLSGKRMVTDIFNLSEVNGGVKTADGKYLVIIPSQANGKLLHRPISITRTRRLHLSLISSRLRYV